MSKYAHWPNALRKTFIKDHSIPISVVQDPYFDHQMEFLDRHYKTTHKASLLNQALLRFTNVDDFHKYMRTTREKIIDQAKKSESYLDFCKLELPDVQFPSLGSSIRKTIYKSDCVGIDLLSIDLVSANFNVIREFLPKLVNNKNTYDDFVSQHTDLPYFKESKQIRQIIFGNLNPKKQTSLMRLIIKRVATNMLEIHPNLEILAISHDEVVFKMKDNSSINYFDFTHSIKSDECTIEKFKLEKLNVDKPIYLKRYPDESFKLKCCPGNYTLEVLRHLYNEDPNINDRVFNLDGRLCTYQEPLF